jgi:hypothetical protein
LANLGKNGCRGMATTPPKKEIEFQPDAWARFERAIDVVAKSPPQHRTKLGKLSAKPKKKAKKASPK